MQSQSGKGYLFLLIVLVLAGLSGWLYTRKDFLYGLDIQGGVRLTYEIVFDEDPKVAAEQRQNLERIRRNMVTILGNRAGQALGVTEANVQPKGETEFIIELPGYTNVNQARDIMRSTAKIRAYHAKNVNTQLVDFREFSMTGQKNDDAGNPFEAFASRNNPTAELTPTDPDYQRMIEGWDLILEGADLQRAEGQVMGNRTLPFFFFSPEGARKMEAWSRSVAGRQENLAFVLDGKVLSIAPLKADAIISNEAFIDGQFDPTYVRNLIGLLNAGALPVDLKETSSMTVDPTIGKQALNQMVFAGAISFGIISLFLIVYYMFPGVVALFALLLYVLFTLSVLKTIDATFSLAAIAGFILSVGMAVDANILVFERVKEEMREGRSLMTAVELGFKRAFPAILDSNACTIITSLVLMYFGTGPVRGFATTLIIGVAISLFTAVFVTRSLLVFLVGSGIGNNPNLYGLGRNWFGEKFEQTADTQPLNIMSRSRLWFAISLATIVIGLPFAFLGGVRLNVEFKGGAEAVFALPAGSNLTANQMTANLERAGYAGSIVKLTTAGDGQRQAFATIPSRPGMDLSSETLKDEIGRAIGLNERPKQFTTVGPSVAQETISNAVTSIIISTTLIVLYLAIRFGLSLGGYRTGFKFGLSAVGALLHDVLVVAGLAAIVGYFFNWEISALFISAALTVIGFSVHDTIVIFDRVRENLKRPLPGETFENLCNRSVTRSLARSLNTSLTVIVTLIILIFFGTATPDLKFFCAAMLFGILSGTYSSIFNATPILYLWDKMVEKRKGANATLLAEALRDQARLRAAQLATAEGDQSYATVKRRNRVKDSAKREID